MLGTKLMSRVAPQLKPIVQSRNMTVIASVPQNRISFAEKVVHGLIITFSMLAIPTYVMLNLKKYKGIAE